MAKILGLDLGTNSIGWAIVDKDGNEFTLVDKGVRIFSEGVKSEKGIESSRAAERTGYRSARKIKYRRKLRKYETLKVLSINGMCPLSIEEVEDWKKSGFKNYPLNPEFLKWLRTSEDENINPYIFRDRASKQKVSLYEFGRALYHIAQRRGFLSNRLDQSAEGILEEHCPKIESIVEDLNSYDEILENLREYFFETGILDASEKSGYAKDLDEGDKAVYDKMGDFKGYSLFHLGSNFNINNNWDVGVALYNIFDKDFTEYNFVGSNAYNYHRNTQEGRRVQLSTTFKF